MSRRDANTTKVFVGSLPAAVTTEDLRRLFAPYGKIVECDIANRCGFLHLEDKDLAMKAIEELNNTNFMGGRISVEKGRVKPPRRSREGGPMRGGRDRAGPYARDDGYGRGPPRNGMGGYGGRDFGYGDRYGDYDRAVPPRSYGSEYDDMGDRRAMYDDRRGYMDDRRGYAPPNGYERRGYDDRAPYPDDRSAYDDRRMPPGASAPVPDGYDDRRPLLGERRPLLDQGASRAPMGGYDRGSTASDMFSRRSDPGPKPGHMLMASMTAGYKRCVRVDSWDNPNFSRLAPSSGSYGDRDSSVGGYGSGGMSGGAYSSVNDGGYGGSASGLGTGYNSGAGGSTYGSTGGGYGSASYGDNRSPGGGYGGSSGTAPSGGGYGNGGGAGGYNSSGTAGGYGDSYSSSRVGGTYDTVYPLPQQRSFASSGGGPGPRRDMPSGPGRRY